MSNSTLLLDSTQRVLGDQATILFGDDKIDRLTRVEFRVWNSGRVVISAAESETSEPLEYRTTEQAHILSAEVESVSDPSNEVSIAGGSLSSIAISFKYLEQRQGFAFSVLISGYIAEPVLSGKLIDIPRGFTRVTQESAKGFFVGVGSLVVIFVALSLVKASLPPNDLAIGIIVASVLPPILILVFGRSPIPREFRTRREKEVESGGA